MTTYEITKHISERECWNPNCYTSPSHRRRMVGGVHWVHEVYWAAEVDGSIVETYETKGDAAWRIEREKEKRA